MTFRLLLSKLRAVRILRSHDEVLMHAETFLTLPHLHTDIRGFEPIQPTSVWCSIKSILYTLGRTIYVLIIVPFVSSSMLRLPYTKPVTTGIQKLLLYW